MCVKIHIQWCAMRMTGDERETERGRETGRREKTKLYKFEWVNGERKEKKKEKWEKRNSLHPYNGHCALCDRNGTRLLFVLISNFNAHHDEERVRPIRHWRSHRFPNWTLFFFLLLAALDCPGEYPAFDAFEQICDWISVGKSFISSAVTGAVSSLDPYNEFAFANCRFTTYSNRHRSSFACKSFRIDVDDRPDAYIHNWDACFQSSYFSFDRSAKKVKGHGNESHPSTLPVKLCAESGLPKFYRIADGSLIKLNLII